MSGISVITKKDLELLRAKASEFDDYMAAQRELSDKHYQMMDVVRQPEAPGRSQALGWLRYESDFGDALLKVMAERGGA